MRLIPPIAADDGTMIALNGVRLHKLARDGRVLANFDTPVSDTRPAPSKTFYGPYDPAISPDGTKVAYTYYYMTQSQDPSCYPPTCVVSINEGGTGYTWSDRQTSWDEPGLGYHSGWRHPSWVDNDMTMLSDPTHLPNEDVILDRISDGGNGHGNLVMNWFSDLLGDNPHVSGGDVSRDKTKLAFQTGENDSTLTLYSVPTFPTRWVDGDVSDDQKPLVCYRYSNPPGGRFSVPTFAPDGGRVAWAAGDGIHVAAVPSFGGGCTLNGATANPPLVIPGGSEPDWGPADVPPARQPGGTGSTGSGSGSGSGSAGSGSTSTTQLSGAQSLAVRLAPHGRTVTVRVRVPGSGRLAAVATSRGRTVGRATRTVRAGTATLKLRIKGRPAKVAVKVIFTPSTGTARTGTATVRLP